MRRESWATGASLLFLLMCRVAAAEEVRIFRDIPFVAALKEAGVQKKIVMVDFYTAVCVPCKRMDMTTWLDPAVGSYLDGRAIPVRIDAWKEWRKLAARYRVTSAPIMLLLRPDSTEIDRLSGFLTADQFLSEIKDSLAGRTSLQRAKAAVAAATEAGDAAGLANSRKALADRLSEGGESAAALKEYLWLFDDGMKKLPEFAGVRRSFVLMGIENLGRSYPPALAALRDRREAARRALTGPGFTEDDARDLSVLNESFGESTATLALFDSFASSDPRKAMLARQVFAQLLSARRYVEAAGARPAEKIRSEFDEGAKDAWSPHAAWDREMVRMNREFVMKNAAEGIEALAGAGRLDDARGLIKRMRSVEEALWVRKILLAHLERAGRAELFRPAD